MPSSESLASPDLKFPPVRVNGSLTRLDLETLMMRSTQRPQPEEASSALEDSNYDMLGDGVMEVSDDEAHTASIASTDAPTPDDTSDEFTDDEADYEMGDRGLQDSIYSSQAEPLEQQSDARPALMGEDSTLTEVPSYLSGSESSWRITLDEQPTDNDEVVQGGNVIQSSTDYTDELPQVFSRYGCEEVRLSVKAALSKHPLPPPDSYKILYIGMPERWAEDITTTQIAMALGAYPSISKSVMVRGQVEPYVPVPQVSRCTGLEVVTSRGKPTRIVAKLEDGKQLEFSHSTAAHFLDRPDLVIMCHRTQPHSSNEREAIDFARTIFAYAEIPCIELAQVIPHGIPSLVEDPAALQVHVEGRDDPNTDYKLKAVLPLNHRGFSRLDPSQLNRHLAYISPRLMTARDTKDSTKAQTSWIGGKIKTFTKKIGVQLPLARTLISALVLCVLIPALFQGAAFAPMLLQKASRSVSALSVLSELENIDSSITPVASESSRLVTPISSSSIPTAMGALTVVPASLKQPSRNPKTEDGKTGSFELQATGDHQFILRPSKAFSSRRKRPQLQIQIACQSQQVPIRYNRTITGEYIVDLEHKYPYGKFNVSIATHSRPLLRQSFEVMLGHNKSMLEQFMDNARSGLMSTQDALRNVSLMATQHMQTYMDVRDIDVASASEQMQQVRQKFQEQFQAKGRLAKQIPGAAWVGLREVTAPVRTSRAMKRARMNALRLRCKMEMAAGLSGKYDEEKQSWACSKVRGDM
ncbi:hypothetical protein COCSADRAFT_41487 [Bipolaris sorokiniana ND90Pr]|uniref:Uncharacterized protein n=1 Tax=Cochliobolus sativus (strain ND90Pr / ATCC 201652) TaxID=665912 RepID=M2QUW4_COCSN|nr:uncharacterized protein COCSADRAFT_41487 [Bipolaris sorokiniana ND90Pr]EMD58929.1 hypothetical protein COCSADRAFT_41487 [Bipolaris sorokiniana ND90Pr]